MCWMISCTAKCRRILVFCDVTQTSMLWRNVAPLSWGVDDSEGSWSPEGGGTSRRRQPLKLLHVTFQNIAVRDVSDVEISSLTQDIEISDLLYMYFISPYFLVASTTPYFAFILKNSISVCVCVCVYEEQGQNVQELYEEQGLRRCINHSI